MLPVSSATASMVIAAIDETPTASPSRPSIRFTAFVMPTIQIIVAGTARMPRWTNGVSDSGFRLVNRPICRSPDADRNGCRHNLHHEFELGAERQHIIENAECDNDGRSEQDAQHGLIELPENQNRTQEAAVNGQTAQPRDRLFVHAACILRHVDRADLVCKVLDRRVKK